jgi:hypothetical protein
VLDPDGMAVVPRVTGPAASIATNPPGIRRWGTRIAARHSGSAIPSTAVAALDERRNMPAVTAAIQPMVRTVAAPAKWQARRTPQRHQRRAVDQQPGVDQQCRPHRRPQARPGAKPLDQRQVRTAAVDQPGTRPCGPRVCATRNRGCRAAAQRACSSALSGVTAPGGVSSPVAGDTFKVS